jgi:5-oxopent-3-ene-1,2,5-tricarboxylate decarboxylase / 2-hydroxyhepta-2,4-diene-1,7-dioate isomerase
MIGQETNSQFAIGRRFSSQGCLRTLKSGKLLIGGIRMKVANYETSDGLIQGIGVVTDNGLIDFTRALAAYQVVEGEVPDDFRSIQEMLETGVFEPDIFRHVMDFVSSAKLTLPLTVEKGYRLLAPIRRPPAIYALGRNFPAHAMEHAGAVPTEPIIFSKAVTSVIGPEDPVVYKKSLTRVDPEAELAVVIGRKGSNISEADASDHIAGYTIVNDVTARDMQNVDIASAHPWFRSKGIDTFCPMGPWVVLPDEIGDQVELDIEMRVNGEVRQKDNTGT